MLKATEDDTPERRAYDMLKGVIYSLNVSDYFKSRLEKELDKLYESWFLLRGEEQDRLRLFQQHMEDPHGDTQAR
jgi:hypothetical protein